MFHICKSLSIIFLIICELHLIEVDSVVESGQSSESSEPTSIIERKTDPADSIFCESDILRDVQMYSIFSDPEYFVNLKLKHPKGDTETKYAKFKETVDVALNENELETFVKDNFEEDKPNECRRFQDSLEFEYISSVIANEDYRTFHKNINAFWKNSAKETDDDVANRPEYHSLLDVPECYIQVGNSNGMPTYWQNYLIVRGALVNAMRATAAGVMRNIAYLIKKHGMALYSNKAYYSTRTQLPLLALMVEDYLEAAEQDDIFLKAIIPAIAKEFLYWLHNRSFRLKLQEDGYEYLMFRYYQLVDRPRPENFKHDMDLASQLPYSANTKQFYSNLYSLDESGFEHTTRFRRINPGMLDLPYLEGHSDTKRLELDIINIVPVELMSVLHRYATLLSAWYQSLIKTTPEKAEEYEAESKKYWEIATDILKSITEVLYNSEKGAWFDFHIVDKKPIGVYYATNLLPLMTTSYDVDRSSEIGSKALKYLISEGIIKYNLQPNFYLIPTSNERNGGLADFPSGSLLLNVLVIEGLLETDHHDAIIAAKELASALIKTVHEGFLNHNSVFENYNALIQNHAVASSSQPQISPAAVGGVNLLLKWFGGKLGTDSKLQDDAGGEPKRKKPDETGEPTTKAEEEKNKKSRTVTGD